MYPFAIGGVYVLQMLDLALPLTVNTLIMTLILVPAMITWIAPFVKKVTDKAQSCVESVEEKT